MLSLYEILKASKTGIAPDMWTALAGMNWGGKDSGAEVKELTGIPPLSFTADGTSLLDYLISGNMTQTGTPTPQNPIQPQECGDYSNLFNEATAVYSKYIDGNGVEQTSTTGENNHSDYIPVKSGVQYTLAETKPSYSGIVSAIAWYTSAKVFIQRDSATLPSLAGRTSNTWTAPSNAAYAIINFYRYPNFSGENDMLNEGSTPLPYEFYGQYKIPISSNNTTTPVYLGEVPTTRKIKKLVLTGEEEWLSLLADSTKHYLVEISPDYMRMENAITYICSHYSAFPQTNSATSVPTLQMSMAYSTTSQRLYIADANYTTDAGFKAYLAQQYANGTPVTIWYVLAEPETVIVNEPLRKIGDYADTVSMEQAQVQIPTLSGQTVVDVETTLKPSEMYIKYQG